MLGTVFGPQCRATLSSPDRVGRYVSDDGRTERSSRHTDGQYLDCFPSKLYLLEGLQYSTVAYANAYDFLVLSSQEVGLPGMFPANFF